MPRTPRHKIAVLVGALIVGLLGGGVDGSAQESPGERNQVGSKAPNATEPVALPFWDSTLGIKLQSAVQLVVHPHPLTIAAIRVIGSEQVLLPEWQFRYEGAPPLRADLLDQIEDKTPVPNMVGKAADEIRPGDRAFYEVYNDALIIASRTPVSVFQKAAEENEHVTFTHLWEQTSDYRGKVVPVRGRLKVVRKWEAPRRAQAEGVRHVYEAWVQGETRRTNPHVVILVELPAGLKPSENLDVPVTFYGYYLKKIRYTAPDADRLTHYLVGPTVILSQGAGARGDDTPFTRQVLMGAVGAFVVIVGLMLAMTWWYRQGDRRVHDQLARLHEPPTILDDSSQEVPMAEPVAPAPPRASQGPSAEPSPPPPAPPGNPVNGRGF